MQNSFIKTFQSLVASKLQLGLSLLAIFSLLSLAAVQAENANQHGHQKTEANGHHDDAKGPHGGRLLSKAGITVELAIVEDNMPPQYRAWISQGDSLLSNSAQAELVVTLDRLGGEQQTVGFKPVAGENYWQGDMIIKEPHSFDVTVTLKSEGSRHQWYYASHEGRMQMTPEMAEKNDITTQTVKGGSISDTVKLYGRLTLSPEQVSHVKARFPGRITSVKVAFGDSVKKGQVLATVESNSSLQSYSVRAPLSGVITAKHANSGEVASEQSLFTITNTGSLWAELKVFPSQARQVKVGQSLQIISDHAETEAEISQILPNTEQHPYLIARAALNNDSGEWFPGLLVEAQVDVHQQEVDLRIPNEAIQSFRDWQVAFIKVGNQYEVRPLQLGLRDSDYSEVKSGLREGDEIVVGNSFLIKADLEKSGASHAH